MSENVNNKSWLLVAFAVISIIGVIVIGVRWSGIRLPSFRSELDLPIGEQSFDPPENIPPWFLGKNNLSSPQGNLAELEACIAKAQSNLPQFIKAISSPTATQSKFCVCVRKRVTDGDGTIPIWYEVVRTASGRYTGTLTHDFGEYSYCGGVVDVYGCDVAEDEIVDWLYYDNGKIVGAYSSGYFHRNR